MFNWRNYILGEISLLHYTFISINLSGVTYIVILSVLKRTPPNTIIVDGGQALFLPPQCHISLKLTEVF